MPATSVLAPAAWTPVAVDAIRAETSRVTTIAFATRTWLAHLPGQHVDVRLTAADGYRAARAYSIGSPPEAPGFELTVERLEDGEVSPFLTDRLRPGDAVEVRGPIGGHFVWAAARASRPLLLVAGGTGIVPLMCMLRHRRSSTEGVPAALLYSCRTRDEVVFRDELAALARGDRALELTLTLTRDAGPGWRGRVGRIDAALVRDRVRRFGGAADAFVCGSSRFVEAAAALLAGAGLPSGAIRTERFGPSGTRAGTSA